MDTPVRIDLKPLTMLVTLAIGIALVAGVDTLSSTTVNKNPPSTPTTAYDFFSAPRVEPDEPQAPSELTCYDPHLLGVWQEIRKDKEFIERTSERFEDLDCSSLLDIKPIDLNRDGDPEFFVRGKNVPLCGGTGNCLFWIFEKKNSRMAVLLAGSDFVEMEELGEQVQRSRTNGYSDILLNGHFTAVETGYYTYKFDGKRYVESRCMYEIPDNDVRKEGSMEMITCEEFQRRLESAVKQK